MNAGTKRVRCAIYTRKSSEEGLEQDFNSLHAQREACAAYVLSQAGEGWELLPGDYDDGGLSGGTLERPALKRLLADVAAGSIDIIVVYKVDRLTRSLLDFSKLVEAFDKAEVSFVSVTQSFNTTTSMGRLTLNMLLSFAHFEREVTAERIRDKIAAFKAKGMWMGGTPPLGYRGDGRSLAIVEEHALIVRLRIPAKEIEGLVTTRVAALFDDPLALAERAELEVRPSQIASLMQRGAELRVSLKGSQRSTIAELVSQVRIAPGHIEIAVSMAQVAELMGLEPAGGASPTMTLTEHMHLTRTGMVVRLIDGTGQGAAPVLDQSVIAMLVKARAWWAVLAAGEINIKALAEQEGVTASWTSRIVRLALLSPTVIEAILNGTLRGDVAGAAFIRSGAVPERWDEQQFLYLPAVQPRQHSVETMEDSA